MQRRFDTRRSTSVMRHVDGVKGQDPNVSADAEMASDRTQLTFHDKDPPRQGTEGARLRVIKATHTRQTHSQYTQR